MVLFSLLFPATTWWMVWVLLPVLSGAVALILDFIFAVIQLTRPSNWRTYTQLVELLDKLLSELTILNGLAKQVSKT